MVKHKKSTQKTQDNWASSRWLVRDEFPEEASVPILKAIRRMEKWLNTRFDNLETSLAGVKTALAANSSRITSLDGSRCTYHQAGKKLRWTVYPEQTPES